jgi:ribose transport system permease protein
VALGQVLTVTVGLILLCVVFGILNRRSFRQKHSTTLLKAGLRGACLIGIGRAYVLITGNMSFPSGSVVVGIVDDDQARRLMTKG